MTIKTLTVAGAILLLCSAAIGGASLKIYLFREAVVEGDDITLASAGIVRGADEHTVAEIRGVVLGKFALSGQQVRIDRNTILSRLASEGFESGDVEISGAESVTVRRDEQIIKSERLVSVAREYIESTGKYSGAKLSLLREPKEWILNSTVKDVNFKASEGLYQREGLAKVEVKVYEDGVEAGSREVEFGVTYKIQRAVASTDIKIGQALTGENIRIETVDSPRPQTDGWKVPYGLVATRPIRKGREITDLVADYPKPPVLIERRQNVMLKIEYGGLLVTSMGEALQEGKVGEFIRVRTGTGRDGRIILGKVMEDGTVRPNF